MLLLKAGLCADIIVRGFVAVLRGRMKGHTGVRDGGGDRGPSEQSAGA